MPYICGCRCSLELCWTVWESISASSVFSTDGLTSHFIQCCWAQTPKCSASKILFSFGTNSSTQIAHWCVGWQETIRAGYVTKDRDLIPGKAKDFLLATVSILVLEPTQPPVRLVTGALSPGEKRLDRETDH